MADDGTFSQLGDALLGIPEYRRLQPLDRTEYKVNIDRGAHIRITPEGMAIYMLVEAPGVFLNDHNRPVPPEVARRAGFPVDKLLRMRAKNEAMAKAQKQIEADFDSLINERHVIDERGDYRLVRHAEESWLVEWAEDGSAMHRGYLPEGKAKELFDSLAGPAPASQPAEVAGKRPAKA